MEREIAIDKGIYLIDDARRVYRFLRRNPDWRELTSEQNRRNKLGINGYTRIFRDERRKVFRCKL